MTRHKNEVDFTDELTSVELVSAYRQEATRLGKPYEYALKEQLRRQGINLH